MEGFDIWEFSHFKESWSLTLAAASPRTCTRSRLWQGPLHEHTSLQGRYYPLPVSAWQRKDREEEQSELGITTTSLRTLVAYLVQVNVSTSATRTSFSGQATSCIQHRQCIWGQIVIGNNRVVKIFIEGWLPQRDAHIKLVLYTVIWEFFVSIKLSAN